MKKLLLFCLLLFISAESIQTAAQESKETKKEQGIFNLVALFMFFFTFNILSALL